MNILAITADKEDLLYVLDVLLIFPAAWFFMYIFAGAVSLNGASFKIGWPYCWIGLIWLLLLILRVGGAL